MPSFWERKIDTSFRRLDVDGDGVITIKDFQAFAEKLIVRQHLDWERGNKLKSTVTEVNRV